MALKLRVISDQYKALGKRSSRLFGVTGGRIGRAVDNDWVLPDPERYVSSHHAKVSFRSGAWILEDTSTNGIFINGSDTPASMEGPYKLQDGDRMRLGDYEILVSIDERNDFSPDASGQMPVPKRVRETAQIINEDLGEELDITDLLSDAKSAKPARTAPYDLNTFSAGAPVKAEPRVAAQPAPSSFNSLLTSIDDVEEVEQRTVMHPKKPDDWQMQTRPYDRRTMTAVSASTPIARAERAPETPAAQTQAPAPAPAPVEKPPVSAQPRPIPQRRSTDFGEAANGLEAFCRGAGIDPSTLPMDAQNALLTQAGQLLREVVLGLTEALKGRSDLKNRLRLGPTGAQPGENNPLKSSNSVDEAVQRLLDTRSLSSIEAVRDAFTDLRTHQSALVAAIQSGMDEFMNRIEPGELQERFDRGLKRGPLLGAANKIKYWDLYVEFYQALNQRNEQGLPPVFAEEMARTYFEHTVKKK